MEEELNQLKKNCSVIRVLAHTQITKIGYGQKKAHLAEIQVLPRRRTPSILPVLLLIWLYIAYSLSLDVLWSNMIMLLHRSTPQTPCLADLARAAHQSWWCS